MGSLLYYLASISGGKLNDQQVTYIAKAISRADLRMDSQVSAAIQYCTDVSMDDLLAGEAAFNEFCGVGVLVKEEEIRKATKKVLEEHREAVARDRYFVNIGMLLKAIKGNSDRMKWAEGKMVKAILDEELLVILGPKTEADLVKPTKSVPLSKGNTVEVTSVSAPSRIFEGDVLKFHKPGENPQPSEAVRQAHLKATGGKVVTRFPPEPNGFLHIGHAKAINFSFSYAAAHGGITYLRYDDTNPEAEEAIYFDSIAESVKWLGYTPFKVTHSSDYFDELYKFAVQLIKSGDAYVCHMSPEEIEVSRGGKDHLGERTESPYRNRSIS